LNNYGEAMKFVFLLTTLLFATSSALPVSAGAEPAPKTEARPQPPQPIQATFDALMKAIENNDHAAFIAQGDEAFKATTPEVVKQVHTLVAPRLAKGMSALYLGELKQQGYRVDLWKLSFQDDGDDWLASLSTKNGLVGGFFLR
jgi:hypothetical protein